MMQERVDIEDCELDDSLVLYNGCPYTGLLFSRYEDGSILEEQEYQNGLPHGVSQEFYPNGNLKRKWFARSGRAEGKLIEFYENGVSKLEEIREFGVVLTSKEWSEGGNLIGSKELDSKSDVYAYVEECRKNRPLKE